MLNFFLMPGETFIYILSTHASWAMALLGIGRNPVVLTIVLATLGWILAFVSAWAMYRLAVNGIRQLNAVCLTIKYRTVQGIGNLKTMITCRLRRWLPKHDSSDVTAEQEVQFDKMDYAVLHAAAEQSPARTTSAPELAERFGMRPAQFQKSLRKLHSSKLIDVTFGSTEGFDNYRLTDYGAAYLSMSRRQRA